MFHAKPIWSPQKLLLVIAIRKYEDYIYGNR